MRKCLGALGFSKTKPTELVCDCRDWVLVRVLKLVFLKGRYITLIITLNIYTFSLTPNAAFDCIQGFEKHFTLKLSGCVKGLCFSDCVLIIIIYYYLFILNLETYTIVTSCTGADRVETKV